MRVRAKMGLGLAALGLLAANACTGSTVLGDGAIAIGGSRSTGGSVGSGGTRNSGGTAGSGGTRNTGGAAGSGGAMPKPCGAVKVAPGCIRSREALIAGSCTLCHDKVGAQAFQTIDFMTDPKGSLVGKLAVYGDLGFPVPAPACPVSREVLLDPNNFDKSLFVTKVRGTGFACGERMPLATTLSSQDMSCILSWACLLSQQ